MKLAAFFLIVVVVVIGMVFVVARKRSRHVGSFSDDVDAMMRDAARDAVEVAKSTHGVELDYTAESIAGVEEILARVHDDQGRSTIALEREKQEAWRWGAYIGEVILRVSPGGGHWEVDHEAGGPRSFPVVVQRGESFPVLWCRSRLRYGAEDNVWAKFQALYGPGDSF